jgi:hypothetical protein
LADDGALYWPATRLLPMMRHDSFSAGFLDTGVKKLATALSMTRQMFCPEVMDGTY